MIVPLSLQYLHYFLSTEHIAIKDQGILLKIHGIALMPRDVTGPMKPSLYHVYRSRLVFTSLIQTPDSILLSSKYHNLVTEWKYFLTEIIYLSLKMKICTPVQSHILRYGPVRCWECGGSCPLCISPAHLHSSMSRQGNHRHQYLPHTHVRCLDRN